MQIPQYVGKKFVDEDGEMVPHWNNVMQQTLDELQVNLSDYGYILPTQDTTTIGLLDTEQSNNAMLIDSDTGTVKVNINGVWKELAFV